MNVGFIGKLGSGKTFAANHLVEEYGFKKISLATPIKEIMKEYFNIIDKTDPRYRKLAQKLGTEWFRSEDNDVWVNYMIKKAKQSDSYLVCDDIRFVNEATKLLNNNWTLFYLDCPTQIRIDRCRKRDGVFDYGTLNHPSETGVDDILKKFTVITIDASDTIENTNSAIDTWMNVLLKDNLK